MPECSWEEPRAEGLWRGLQIFLLAHIVASTQIGKTFCALTNSSSLMLFKEKNGEFFKAFRKFNNFLFVLGDDALACCLGYFTTMYILSSC